MSVRQKCCSGDLQIQCKRRALQVSEKQKQDKNELKYFCFKVISEIIVIKMEGEGLPVKKLTASDTEGSGAGRDIGDNLVQSPNFTDEGTEAPKGVK